MTTENSMQTICSGFLEEAMEYNDLPALAIGVTMGEEEWIGAAGVRDVTTRDPLEPGDVFHCASVSKLFTSVAVMQLAQAGVIRLSDRLSDLLPDLRFADPRAQDIRIEQMLSHTSGLGDVEDYRWQEALTAESALSDYVHSDEVLGLPLLWAPGEGGFRYSNTAYEILGYLVAVKSAEYTGGGHLSYEDFIERFLLKPAGMTDSTMFTPGRLGIGEGDDCPLLTEAIRSGGFRMAQPHAKATDRRIVPMKVYPYTRSHAPSSTLTSSAADLLKWARVHMDGLGGTGGTILLPASGYDRIRQKRARVPNNGEEMGLGWFMREQNGCRLFGHEGTDDGFRASLWICPERRIGIAVLSNLSGVPVKRLNKKLFDRLVPSR